MVKVYKIVLGNKITKDCFLAKDAKSLKEYYENKGLEPKVVLFKENVKILDMVEMGKVRYYMEENIYND